MGDGNTVCAIDVWADSPPDAIFTQLQLAAPPRAIVTISGGASRFPTSVLDDAARLVDALVQLGLGRSAPESLSKVLRSPSRRRQRRSPGR
jgi:hypothetical protein